MKDTRQNRYNRTVNFVAPWTEDEQRIQAARHVIDEYAQPAPVDDVTAVWTPTASRGTRDHVSAMDRAMGLQRRMAIVAIIGGAIALAAVIAYSATLGFLRVDAPLPFMLDRLLLFLLVWGGLLLWVFGSESQRDYDHSHAGVERLRIIEAADLRREQIRAEAAVRREQLALSLKLLDDRTKQASKLLDDRSRRYHE